MAKKKNTLQEIMALTDTVIGLETEVEAFDLPLPTLWMSSFKTFMQTAIAAAAHCARRLLAAYLQADEDQEATVTGPLFPGSEHDHAVTHGELREMVEGFFKTTVDRNDAGRRAEPESSDETPAAAIVSLLWEADPNRAWPGVEAIDGLTASERKEIAAWCEGMIAGKTPKTPRLVAALPGMPEAAGKFGGEDPETAPPVDDRVPSMRREILSDLELDLGDDSALALLLAALGYYAAAEAVAEWGSEFRDRAVSWADAQRRQALGSEVDVPPAPESDGLASISIIGPDDAEPALDDHELSTQLLSRCFHVRPTVLADLTMVPWEEIRHFAATGEPLPEGLDAYSMTLHPSVLADRLLDLGFAVPVEDIAEWASEERLKVMSFTQGNVGAVPPAVLEAYAEIELADGDEIDAEYVDQDGEPIAGDEEVPPNVLTDEEKALLEEHKPMPAPAPAPEENLTGMSLPALRKLTETETGKPGAFAGKHRKTCIEAIDKARAARVTDPGVPLEPPE